MKIEKKLTGEDKFVITLLYSLWLGILLITWFLTQTLK